MKFFKDHWLGVFISGVCASLVAAVIYAFVEHALLPSKLGAQANKMADSRLNSSGDVDRNDANGNSSLTLNKLAIGAAKTKDWRMLERLLNQGADPNTRDENGQPLLFKALAWPDSAQVNTDLSVVRC